MTNLPKEITAVVLDCVLMPNGEIISLGKTIGYFKEFKNSLHSLEDFKKAIKK